MGEILRLIEARPKSEQLGFLALVCLAMRENTTIQHQQDEWSFEDVPSEIVIMADALEDYEQLALVTMISSEIAETDTDELREHNLNAQ
ncbi:MAG: hypothetical protein RMX63_34570 [Aulosira sp. ZfuCHP01]|nr:hypothetical protein [Aulosira sp. ZfuVER01]MDZ8002341.1 hypothetical protein [Aulosira sp. DedVER01a]MDZ8056551.1 hypothetical protein [Aulosira sp. ZfuCHP01]